MRPKLGVRSKEGAELGVSLRAKSWFSNSISSRKLSLKYGGKTCYIESLRQGDPWLQCEECDNTADISVKLMYCESNSKLRNLVIVVQYPMVIMLGIAFIFSRNLSLSIHLFYAVQKLSTTLFSKCISAAKQRLELRGNHPLLCNL
ncbi:hypothetical protein L873DRAFT_475238 [Choiromyces venosus 120613-1]|uniref:Uncharacterized protein n=1 Tax=Choiromyces venosus 120613-1 TaxID=1336337 RepID=A0A3N4IVJ2_9PEZI|nr:hypothetical protein L873DRAFT_475238 [Choiromyces venosus 120613-1]